MLQTCWLQNRNWSCRGEGVNIVPVQKIDINMEFRRPVGELFALLSDHEKMGQILGANVKRTRDGKDSLPPLVQASYFFLKC
jgi:hypothetical protein